MTGKPQVDENTLRTMQALLQQPPKPHDEMKIGKRKTKKAATKRKKAATV